MPPGPLTPFLVFALAAVAIGASVRWLPRLLVVVSIPPLLLVGIAATFVAWVASGPDWHTTSDVMPGVVYERVRVGDAVVHLALIDLADDCVVIATSAVDRDGTAVASRTIDWARAESMTVAVNGGFFYPYEARLLSVTPGPGEAVKVIGPVVRPASGRLPDRTTGESLALPLSVSDDATPWFGVAFQLDAAYRPSVRPEPDSDAALAVTGRFHLLEEGQVVAPVDNPRIEPRTIVAADPATNRMWLMVVDGRQLGYSPGMELADAAAFLASRGATEAVELDGGGSSTMVIDDGDGAEVVSRPIQRGIPGRSRVVANHVGVRSADAATCARVAEG